MLKRWSADALDRELARHNPVSDSQLAAAAHTPPATALLRRIFDMADAARAAGVDGAGTGGELGPTGAVPAGVAGELADAWAGPGRTDGRTPRPFRRVATAVAVLVVLAGGVPALVLTITGNRIPHRSTTAWLASRPLAADEHSASSMSPRVGTQARPIAASPWHLVGDIVPAGWKLGTPGPGPGMVTCPTTEVCYVTGDTSTSAQGLSQAGGLYVSTDGASSWSVLALPQGFTFTSELTCVAATVCAAGGTENGTAVFAETGDGGHRWTVTTTGKAGWLVHLTCVSARRCMGLSLVPSAAAAMAKGTSTPGPFAEAFARTTDGGDRWTTTALPGTVRFSALQCMSAASCVTIGYPSGTQGATPRGVALWTDDAGLRWQHGTLPAGVGFSDLSGLSCGGPARCMAVATVADPATSCSASANRTTLAPIATLTAPACGSAAWVSTMLTTQDRGATWQLEPLPASVPQPRLDGVACPQPLTCWAGGEETVQEKGASASSVLVGTANGGISWTAATVPVPSSPRGSRTDDDATVGSISCPTTTVCVALGGVDQGAKSAPVYRMDATP